LSHWRDKLSGQERKALKRVSMPKWTRPMLATLTDERFSAPDWIFERKLDGERCLVFRRKSRLHILSRNQQDLNDTYPELVDMLKAQPSDHYIADGEIVAFEGNVTSFSRLQGRIGIKDADEARESGIKVYLYLFDLIFLDGWDVTGLPLRTRKRLLRSRFDFSGALRFTAHRNENGEAFFKHACDRGWEGLIAKRADSAYIHSRSRRWLKFKCVHRQELIVGGFTDPGGSRIGFGALLLGYYEKGSLRYAGKVGTGFDNETLREMKAKLASIEQDACPYEETPDESGAGVHWVKPKLVAQIGFTEWTADDRLRHPRFLGLRRDKSPGKVKREKAK